MKKKCMYADFVFHLQTNNIENQQYCEPYAAVVYHLIRSYEYFNGDITQDELKIEREHVYVFDRENNNPVMDMTNYVIQKFKGKAKIITNKHNKKITSSYEYQLAGTTTFLDLIITFF